MKEQFFKFLKSLLSRKILIGLPIIIWLFLIGKLESLPFSLLFGAIFGFNTIESAVKDVVGNKGTANGRGE